MYGVELKHRLLTEPDVRAFSFDRESGDAGAHPLQHTPENDYDGILTDLLIFGRIGRKPIGCARWI
jgi:hypothetical protein